MSHLFFSFLVERRGPGAGTCWSSSSSYRAWGEQERGVRTQAVRTARERERERGLAIAKGAQEYPTPNENGVILLEISFRHTLYLF